MSSRVAFHDKLVSVMEVLANAAVAEICQLVDEGYALLRLEVSQRQKENEELRMKLQTMELLVARERVELRAVGGGRHVEQAPVGQVEDSQVDGSGSDPDSPVKVALLDTVCLPAVCCVDVSSAWFSSQKVSVQGMCVTRSTKGPEAKEPGADRLLIKEETLEEPLGNSNDEEDGDNDDDDAKVNTGNQQGGEGIMDAVKRHPVGDTCVTAWLSEHLEMGHGIREGAAPEAALKMEPGREVMEETPAITESEDKLDRMSVNFVCSARECSAQLGQVSEMPTVDAQVCTDITDSQMELRGEGADGVQPPVGTSRTEPKAPTEFVMHSAWNRDTGSRPIQTQHRHHGEDGQRTGVPPKSGANLSLPLTHTMTVSHGPDANRFIAHYKHLAAPESTKTSARFEPRGKVFVCKFCGKCCTRSSNLKRHQRIHTGEKPFSCTLCGKKFTQSCSLKRHQSIHMGSRPFHCATCRRQFSDPSGLQRHQCLHWRKTV